MSKFIPTINKTLYLKGNFALNPNNQDDKRIAYAAFAKAGFKNVGKMKDTEEGWIKKMTLGDSNRRAITKYIKDMKLQQLYELEQEIENERTFSSQQSDINMPAADMQNFIDTDDVSQLNEYKQYLTEARQLDQAIKIFQNFKPDVNERKN